LVKVSYQYILLSYDTKEIGVRLMGVLTIALPLLVLSISIIFDYSQPTYGQTDTTTGSASRDKTTTAVTTVYNHHNNNPNLQITSNKQTYKPGESVVITIKNNGKYPLEFPDSLLGLTIQNTKTQQKAGLLGSQVMSELKPNQSKTIQWDQKDIDGKQVQPGTYNAQTSLTASGNSSSVPPIAASTSFAIK
jgi:uncharacterized cupredoxin-like copper-binding protein